jgi:hypothetical protein
MEIRPILSALLRNRAGAILVALQIALTLAIVVNAVFLTQQRVSHIGRPSGIDDQNIFSFWLPPSSRTTTISAWCARTWRCCVRCRASSMRRR